MTSEAQVNTLYEALLWVSEYPNRHPDGSDDAVTLADDARDALNVYELQEARAELGEHKRNEHE